MPLPSLQTLLSPDRLSARTRVAIAVGAVTGVVLVVSLLWATFGLTVAVSVVVVMAAGGVLFELYRAERREAEEGEVPATAAATEPVETSVATPPVRRGQTNRILIVEDNLVNQKLTCAMLAAQGFHFDIVDNGAKAVDQVQQDPYGLVLMDIQMPVMDGIEATKRIRALGEPLANIPIVAVTANAMHGDKETYMAAGMDDFVPKPVDPRQLIGVVELFVKKPDPDEGDGDGSPAVESQTAPRVVGGAA